MVKKKKHTIRKVETAMEENKQLTLEFKNISGKKVTADYKGGEVTSDVGVMIEKKRSLIHILLMLSLIQYG